MRLFAGRTAAACSAQAVWAHRFISFLQLISLSGSWRIRNEVSHPRPSSGVQGEPKPRVEGDGLGVFAGGEQGGRRDGEVALREKQQPQPSRAGLPVAWELVISLTPASCASSSTETCGLSFRRSPHFHQPLNLSYKGVNDFFFASWSFTT